jgi:hypothetical protein
MGAKQRVHPLYPTDPAIGLVRDTVLPSREGRRSIEATQSDGGQVPPSPPGCQELLSRLLELLTGLASTCPRQKANRSAQLPQVRPHPAVQAAKAKT